MLFCTLQFAPFFAVVFTLYWALPTLLRRLFGAGPEAGHRGRIWLLLVASFTFYASWNHWLAILICVTSAMDYYIARGLEASSSARVRRGLLILSLVVNLGLLAYFKYVNFFLGSLENVIGACGGTASLMLTNIILPVGISFYTFEAINYTVDVYQRRVKAEPSLANFILFITFFPHLIAGPIVRARDFLPQIRRRKHWNWSRLQVGVQLFLIGLFKKWAIGDHMAHFADPVFKDPAIYGSLATWAAVIAYTLQIYGDFSGYTDMALGLAHMFGYHLALNFNMPYLAANVSEFWHRWHISLSSWLRDYLFIPLGGSRGGERKTCRNLMLTMTLGGLWHGASWTFVVWGALHGLALIVHRGFRALVKPRPTLDAVLSSYPGTACRMALTLLVVMIGWVFFRAQSFTDAATVLNHLFVPHLGQGTPLKEASLWLTLLVVVQGHIVGHYRLWERFSQRLPAPALGLSYALALSLTLLLAPDTGKTFIYFVF